MANQAKLSGSTSSVDLHLELGARGLRSGLEQALREAIRSGRLHEGARLPATRALARDLGLSRGTVAQAYAQLAAEGWIAGRRGSGTVVAARPESVAAAAEEPAPRRYRHDLRPGRPDPSSFPRADWLRALRRALAAAPDDAFGYGDAAGQPALRMELAGYLARARGLRVSTRDVVVTTGFTQGLHLLARALRTAGVAAVAMEEPSMPRHREAVRREDLRVELLEVDADGARVEDVGRAGAVVLTPNRQHPLGMPLAPARRAALLDRARASGIVVVEDDYDGEFRYDGRPIGALQGLEPRCVVYAGTASKSLAPALRLGWLVVPEPLRTLVLEEKSLVDWQSGAIEQLALAELLRGGGYDRHVRRLRLRYRRRRDLLVAALGARPVLGTAAGLNLLVPLDSIDEEQELLAAAAARGIALEGLASAGYYEREPRAGIVIGYAAAPEHSARAAVAEVAELLRR